MKTFLPLSKPIHSTSQHLRFYPGLSPQSEDAAVGMSLFDHFIRLCVSHG
jgi:hypothetical protein